jgi:hypothetical protein
MNGIFINPTNEHEYSENGFLIRSLFSEKEIDDLNNNIKPFYCNSPKGFTYSLIDNGLITNKKIKDVLHPILALKLNLVLYNYQLLVPSFLTKSNIDTFDFHLHHDWNYTDEFFWYSVTVWIPLEDVTQQNGCIYLLPGSHNKFKTIRSGTLDTARIPLDDTLSKQIKKIEMRKGEVLFFNPAIFHGSFPNNSSFPRIAITGIVKHINAPFIHYFQEKNSTTLFGYYITENDFSGNLPKMAKGEFPFEKVIYSESEYIHEIITKEKLKTLLFSGKL